VDSLEKLLRNAKHDTLRVELLDQLFEEHIDADTALAREYAEQSIKLSRRSEYSPGIANYFLNLARLDARHENWRQARNHIQTSLDMYEDLGHRKAVAEGYHAMGFCLFQLRDYDLSMEYYNEALKIREDIQDTSGLIESYRLLGDAHHRRGDYPISLEFRKKLMSVLLSGNDAGALADCYNSIGWSLNNMGDNDKAIEYFTNALETFRSLGDSTQLGNTYNYIGIVYVDLSDYPKSIEYFQRSLAIRETLGDSSTIADCLNNIGLVYELQADFPRALDYYLLTLEYREKLNAKSRLGTILSNIGNVYYRMKDTTHALEYYNRSMEIFSRLDEKTRLANIYIGIGNVFMDKQEYASSLEQYMKALEIFEASGDRGSLVVCLINIGRVYYYQGKYQESIETSKEGLDLATEIGNVRRAAMLSAYLGMNYNKMGRYSEAIEYGLKGYALGKESVTKEAMQDAARVLSESYASTGSYRQAYDYQVIYKAMSDSLLNAENIREISALENQFKFDQEKQAAALESQIKAELHAAEVKKQQILRNAFIVAFSLMIVIAGLIFRGYRQKQKVNLDLQDKNTFISQQKEEIETQKDEIEQQKEELQITLDHLRETQEQLIQSEKLAALGNLVAGVAHEINTPVGISVTAASSLAEETSKMAESFVSDKISRAAFKEYLSTTSETAKLILANMERTAEMVQSFKQVSVDQSTEQKRKFKFRDHVEDVIKSLTPRFEGKKIEIEINIDEQLEPDSHPGAFSQIITNLVLNSVIHGYGDKGPGKIQINGRVGKKELTLEIMDKGKGIAKQDLPKIFDPFFTTDNTAGTGLGLHIVHNLVTRQLGGTISCKSIPDQETTFSVAIPL
jgi:signal transduction histidine kinase